MDGKKIALKITGIIVGIIVVCVLLSLLVGVPLLKNTKYKNAEKNAEVGNYVVALSELSGKGMDKYKDVELKRQQYAFEAGKQFIKDGDNENAAKYLEYSISIDKDKTLTDEAMKLYETTSK